MGGRQPKKTSFILPLRAIGGGTLIELLIVAGIVSLVIGASFVFLTTARKSADLSEVQLQTKEYAQQAMERITRELRLSRPSGVRIRNDRTWNLEISPGAVINFQIPVGTYTNLDLTEDNTLRWGSEANEGHYLAYSVNGNSQLLRSTYTASDGSGLTSQIIAPHISAITFSRVNTSSDLIRIQITAEVQGPYGLVTQTLISEVKLRNL